MDCCTKINLPSCNSPFCVFFTKLRLLHVGFVQQSQTYYDLSQAYHFTPSMSKRGCPYDNSSMENFFGTLKVECLNRRKFASMSELQEIVAQYVQFYNDERIQLKSGLTPYEIRSKTA